MCDVTGDRRVLLTVDRLGCNLHGERLDYRVAVEAEGRASEITGSFVGKISSPYTRDLGRVPAGADVRLITTDPRLSLGSESKGG